MFSAKTKTAQKCQGTRTERERERVSVFPMENTKIIIKKKSYITHILKFEPLKPNPK